MAKCKYNLCNGSGLLPFTGKDGKVRKDVQLFCDCHPQYGVDSLYDDHYTPLKPEDIDYSVSYSYYRSLCQYHGWPVPDSDRLSEPEPEQRDEVVHRVVYQHSDLTADTLKRIDRLELSKLTKQSNPKPQKESDGNEDNDRQVRAVPK